MFCSFSVEPKNNKISFDADPCSLISPIYNHTDQQNEPQKTLNSFSSSVRKITGGTKKRKWTSEEDFLLMQAVNAYGVDNWNLVSQRIENRSGKQCRERWMSNMCPTLVKENWTHQEDLILIQKQSEFGNKWTLIHNFLPGRSNTSIKNRWKCLCRRSTSIKIQIYNETNKISMSQPRETSQAVRSGSLYSNVQQNQRSQNITHDFIDSLFDGDCWSEFETYLSLKI